MARFTALIDSSVLYSRRITPILLEVAKEGVFRAIWSESIHEEWIRSLLKNNQDLTPEQLERRKAALNAAIPDCLIEGYEPLVGSLNLPDANDNHVLAAAIKGKADVIVTQNLRHFPQEKVGAWKIEVQDADNFLIYQRGLNELTFLECVKRVRQRLTRPTLSPDEYLDGLRKAGLILLSSELEKTKSLL